MRGFFLTRPDGNKMFSALRNWTEGELITLPRDFISASLMPTHKDTFRQVKTFCIFLGHSRSGHSLLASLLDAHKNIVIADEIRALKYFAAGFSAQQVYKLILHNSRRIGEKQRKRAGYQFEVPGQWQGRYEAIEVIGEKDGSWTAAMALRNFKVIEAAYARVPAEIRVIHLYRNPFDVISTIYRRYQAAGNLGPLQHSIDFYFRRTEGIEKIRRFAPSEGILDLSHENFVSDPEAGLRRVCAFLSVECDEEFLKACGEIVFAKPQKTRNGVTWDEAAISHVYDRARAYDYLRDYRFD